MRRQIDSTPGIVIFLGSTFWVRGSAVPVIVAFLGVLAVRSKNGRHDGTVRCAIFVAGQINYVAGRSNFFCLPRRYGRFSLYSVLRKFKECLLTLRFFLVLGLPLLPDYVLSILLDLVLAKLPDSLLAKLPDSRPAKLPATRQAKHHSVIH